MLATHNSTVQMQYGERHTGFLRSSGFYSIMGVLCHCVIELRLLCDNAHLVYLVQSSGCQVGSVEAPQCIHSILLIFSFLPTFVQDEGVAEIVPFSSFKHVVPSRLDRRRFSQYDDTQRLGFDGQTVQLSDR